MNRKSLSLSLGIALLACLPLSAQTAYNFTEVNYTGDTFTQLLGINNSEIVAGYHGADVNKGFTYNFKTGVFTNENFPGSAQTQVIGINNLGVTVGFYIDSKKVTHGFRDDKGTFTTVDQPGTKFNQLLGQNDVSQAAGYYSANVAGSAPDHAYIYNEEGGVFETFTIPLSVQAQATGINKAGSVCGFSIDSKGMNHGWLLVQGQYTVLNYPGSTGTQALGLNNKGMVVGSYTDKSNNSHGFTYTIATKAWQTVDDPSGVGSTVVNGVNDKGMLVGFWGNAPLNTGFVATVAP